MIIVVEAIETYRCSNYFYFSIIHLCFVKSCMVTFKRVCFSKVVYTEETEQIYCLDSLTQFKSENFKDIY